MANDGSGADRVVFASNVPGYEDLKTTVTGEDVNKLVQAVANSRKLSPNVDCTPNPGSNSSRVRRLSQPLPTAFPFSGLTTHLTKTPPGRWKS